MANAANTLKKIKLKINYWDLAVLKSLVILTRAVLGEWWIYKPNWSEIKRERKKNGDSKDYFSEEFCYKKEQRNGTVLQGKCEIKRDLSQKIEDKTACEYVDRNDPGQ